MALRGLAMTVSGDYYEVLGVPRDADAETIKDAFRKLARRYHPDTSTEPDAEQRFKEIAEAYGVLSDPAKRASYDAQGSAGLAGATAEDLWGGSDVHLDLVVSLEEVLAGGTQEVTIRRPGPCPQCRGWGRAIGRPCPACGASGRDMRGDKVTIRIPPGIPEGAMLRLAGHGMPSPVPGGPPGDAYVSIRTRADPRFTREGTDLW